MRVPFYDDPSYNELDLDDQFDLNDFFKNNSNEIIDVDFFWRGVIQVFVMIKRNNPEEYNKILAEIREQSKNNVSPFDMFKHR